MANHNIDTEESAIEQTPAAVPIQPLNLIYIKPQIKQQKISIKSRKTTKIINALTIMSFNMRSWAINNTAIESYISENPPPDVWLLQETWLT